MQHHWAPRMAARLAVAAGCVCLLLAGCAAQPTAAIAPQEPARPDELALGPHTAGVAAGQLTQADVGRLPHLGSRNTGQIAFLGKSIALPAGTWTVVSLQKSTFAGYPPGAKIALLRQAGNRLTGIMAIAGNAVARPARGGYPLNPVCAAAAAPHNGLVFTDIAPGSTAGGAQDCLAIAVQDLRGLRDADHDATDHAIARSLDRLGLALPAAAVLIAYGLTDDHDRLTEQLRLIPDDAGQDGWTTAAGPARQAYLDKVISWSLTWRPAVAAALKGRAFDAATVAAMP